MCAARQSPTAGPTPGAWGRQDGQVITEREHGGSHVQDQWDLRCPAGWEGFPVRSAWCKGVDHPYGDDETAARVHVKTEMLIISQLGFLQTTIPAAWEGIDVEEVTR
jgi:hypothetical protein